MSLLIIFEIIFNLSPNLILRFNLFKAKLIKNKLINFYHNIYISKILNFVLFILSSEIEIPNFIYCGLLPK